MTNFNEMAEPSPHTGYNDTPENVGGYAEAALSPDSLDDELHILPDGHYAVEPLDDFDVIEPGITHSHGNAALLLAASELKPAREITYPTAATYCGHDLPNTTETAAAFTAARVYLQTVVPDITVESLSNEGTTAVVMHDGELVYKVFRRHYGGYDRAENEMAALTLLHQAGITQRPITLIDALPEERYAYPDTLPERTSPSKQPLYGGRISIMRMQGTGHLPVIVSELKDIGPIAELPDHLRATEFDRFALVALKHNLLYQDCRVHYDKQAGRATIVDVGWVTHHYYGDNRNTAVARYGRIEEDQAFTSEALREADIVRDTFIRFTSRAYPAPSIRDIAALLAKGGDLSALHPLLHERSER